MPDAVVWETGGLVFRASPAGESKKRAVWDPKKHPRYPKGHRHAGRFIRTGDAVSVGGRDGRVVGTTSGGKLSVERADGSRVSVSPEQLAAPDASAPSRPSEARAGGQAGNRAPSSGGSSGRREEAREGQAAGAVPQGPQREEVPQAPAVERPPKPPKVKGSGEGRAIKVTALAASQRKAIREALDVNGQPEEVREAARAVADNREVTAAQALRVIDAAREAADGPDVSPAQARVLARSATRLESVPFYLTGVKPAHVPGRDGVVKGNVGDLREGDMVALPDGSGNVQIVRVAADSKRHYQLYEVVTEEWDGEREVRYLIPDTDVYVMPDLPDPEPVKPEGSGHEHLTPDRLRPGDVFRFGNSDFEYRVISTEPGVYPGEWQIKHVGAKSPESVPPSTGAAGTGSMMPSVVRVQRGDASADQPWDSMLPEEDPQTVPGMDLKVGDRIQVTLHGRAVGATVVDATDGTNKNGVPVKTVAYLTDGATPGAVHFTKDQHTVRLAAGGDGAAERVARQRAEAEQARIAEQVAHRLQGHAQEVRRVIRELAENSVNMANLDAGRDDLAERAESMARTAFGEPGSRMSVKPSAHVLDELATNFLDLGASDDQKTALKERLAVLFDDVGRRTRDEEISRVVATIQASRPVNFGESDAGAAAAAVHNMRFNSPPGQDYRQPARVLAQLQPTLSSRGEGGAGAGLPEVPDLPEGVDLKARMDAYRAALGAEFGKRPVTAPVFKETSLEDLEAGKVPEIEQVGVEVPDRAADGGPGEAAMRQLAVLRAAGADLDAELQRRMQPDLDELTRPLSGAELQELIDRQDALRAEHEKTALDKRNWYARQRGYESWSALLWAAADAEGTAEEKKFSKWIAGGDKAAVKASEGAFREYMDVTRRIVQVKQGQKPSKKTIAEIQRRHTIAMLAELRDGGMGGHRIAYRNSKGGVMKESGELVEAMRYAEAGYPTDWLKKADGHLTLKEVDRGHYNHWKGEIALSYGYSQTDSDGPYGRVADHELGHRMEKSVPGLLAAQEAFLWDRTSTGEVGARVREQKKEMEGYKEEEKAYHDDFPIPYTGKDYGVYGSGQAFEVFTTAKESLTAGSPYLDEDLRRWVLGALVLL